MLQELEDVRQKGFAVSFGERDPQLFSLAAPLLKAGGVLVGALALSGPRIRLTPDQVPQLAKLLTDSARDLSAILGYQDEPAPFPKVSGQWEPRTAMLNVRDVRPSGPGAEGPIPDLVVHALQGPVGDPQLGPGQDAIQVAADRFAPSEPSVSEQEVAWTWCVTHGCS